MNLFNLAWLNMDYNQISRLKTADLEPLTLL
jgi:Leucine-rich repeat (LRR) protein